MDLTVCYKIPSFCIASRTGGEQSEHGLGLPTVHLFPKSSSSLIASGILFYLAVLSSAEAHLRSSASLDPVNIRTRLFFPPPALPPGFMGLMFVSRARALKADGRLLPSPPSPQASPVEVAISRRATYSASRATCLQCPPKSSPPWVKMRK